MRRVFSSSWNSEYKNYISVVLLFVKISSEDSFFRFILLVIFFGQEWKGTKMMTTDCATDETWCFEAQNEIKIIKITITEKGTNKNWKEFLCFRFSRIRTQTDTHTDPCNVRVCRNSKQRIYHERTWAKLGTSVVQVVFVMLLSFRSFIIFFLN